MQVSFVSITSAKQIFLATYEMSVQEQEIHETPQDDRLVFPPLDSSMDYIVSSHTTGFVQPLERRVEVPLQARVPLDGREGEGTSIGRDPSVRLLVLVNAVSTKSSEDMLLSASPLLRVDDGSILT
jgi:hypothetical protein